MNRGSGAEPPAGSRGRAPSQGIRGRSLPPEAESFSVVGYPKEIENHILIIGSVCLCQPRGHYLSSELKTPKTRNRKMAAAEVSLSIRASALDGNA